MTSITLFKLLEPCAVSICMGSEIGLKRLVELMCSTRHVPCVTIFLQIDGMDDEENEKLEGLQQIISDSTAAAAAGAPPSAGVDPSKSPDETSV